MILPSGSERGLHQQDLLDAIEKGQPSTVQWLDTTRNLSKYGGGSRSYKAVEKHLRSTKMY